MKESEVNDVESQEPLSIMEIIEDKLFAGSMNGLTKEQQECSESILKEGEERNKKKAQNLKARYEKVKSRSQELMTVISEYIHHESLKECRVFAEYLDTMLEDFNKEFSNSVTEYQRAKHEELLDRVSEYEDGCRERMLLAGKTPTAAEEFAQEHGLKISSSLTEQRESRYKAYKQNVASAKEFMNKAAPVFAELDALVTEDKIRAVAARVSVREARLKVAEEWATHCRMELEAERIKLKELE